jgi:hypothetical protein
MPLPQAVAAVVDLRELPHARLGAVVVDVVKRASFRPNQDHGAPTTNTVRRARRGFDEGKHVVTIGWGDDGKTIDHEVGAELSSKDKD